MAPVSKGKVGSDHIVAFNVAVTEWKSKRTEKVMAELDRILSVLSKISDHSVFSTKKPEVMTFMINCQLVLSSLDHKTNTTWTVISLLTTICTRDVTLCHVLRDRTRMLPVCAKLLHSIPPTTQARTVKLLSFMKLVGEGVRISRREAWLSSLIADLVNFLSTPELSSHSLFLLCCLCQGNYIATKLVISLPTATLTDLTVTSQTSPGDQLTTEILLYYMTKYQLTRLPPSQSRVQSYLPLLLDVFCSSYSIDDISMMSLIISFLSSLSTDPDLRDLLSQQDCLPQLQQLLIIHDFSDGFSELSASHLFTFLTVLITTYSCDYVSIYDQTLKVVLMRLDAKPSINLASTLNFMSQLLKRIDFTAMSEAVARNLKFQIDQLLPSLLSLFVDSTKASTSSKSSGGKTSRQDTAQSELEPELYQSLVMCLTLLETISLVEQDGWSQSVAVNVKATKMMSAYISSCSSLADVGERARLTVEFLSLAALLAEADTTWITVEQLLLADQERVDLVSSFVRMENTDGATMKKALRLLSKIDSPEMLDQARPQHHELVGGAEGEELPGETLGKIDNLLEDVQSSLKQMQLDDVVVEVLQLADSRRGVERSQTAHLMAALSAADERLAAQNLALLEREEELRSVEKLVARLVARLGATKEELEDMRSQHGELSREADITRDKLARELDDLQGQVDELTVEKQNVSEKVVKYKSQVVSLTKDLEQYQENQDQLEKKLKQELKMKEEVSVKLSKKEDKLRKKERQLEEEMTNRERAEKEIDNLKKQCSSLETLSKRQEQALAKKEKQLQESQEEVKDMKKIQDAIFNLSKTRNSSTAAC